MSELNQDPTILRSGKQIGKFPEDSDQEQSIDMNEQETQSPITHDTSRNSSETADFDTINSPENMSGKHTSAENMSGTNDLMSMLRNLMEQQTEKLGNELKATRSELKEQSSKIEQRIEQSHNELREQVIAQGKELRQQIGQVKKELRDDMTQIQDRLEAKIKIVTVDSERNVEKVREELEIRIDKTEEKVDKICGVSSEIRKELRGVEKKQQADVQLIKDKLTEEMNILKEQEKDNRDRIEEIEHRHDNLEIELRKETKELSDRIQRNGRNIRDSRTGTSDVIGGGFNFSMMMGRERMLPKFWGSESNPLDFLNAVERKLGRALSEEYITWDQAEEIITMSLEKDAAKWYQINRDKFRSLEDFSRIFKEKYWHAGKVGKLRDVIAFGRYEEQKGGTRVSYFLEKILICKSITPEIVEEDVIRRLVPHFCSEIQLGVWKNQITTINAMERLLGEYDSLREITRNNRRAEREVEPRTAGGGAERTLSDKGRGNQNRPHNPHWSNNNNPQRNNNGYHNRFNNNNQYQDRNENNNNNNNRDRRGDNHRPRWNAEAREFRPQGVKVDEASTSNPSPNLNA